MNIKLFLDFSNNELPDSRAGNHVEETLNESQQSDKTEEIGVEDADMAVVVPPIEVSSTTDQTKNEDEIDDIKLILYFDNGEQTSEETNNSPLSTKKLAGSISSNTPTTCIEGGNTFYINYVRSK